MRWMVTALVVAGFAAPARAAIAEPAMTEQPALRSWATAIDAHFIQLVLQENPYSGLVGETARYAVTSTDDPAFATAVAPVAVAHRHFPEDAWHAGSHDAATIATVHLTHRIFLEVPVALTEGRHYRVQVDPAVLTTNGPFDLDFGITPNEAIHVNQVAYLAAGPKVAYLSAWTGQGTVPFTDATTFEVVDEATDAVVHSGSVQLDAAAERWSGSDVHSLDFGAVTGPGTYHLRVPVVGRSYSFAIGPDAFNRIGYTVIRGLTMQRDGQHGLTDAVTHWSRPPAHLDDAIDQHTGARVDLVGGHMDAGDRGKYPHNSADAAGSLLCAMLLFPDEVTALGETLDLPESANGVPDFVDEALHEVDYLAKTALNTSKDGAQPYYLKPSTEGYELGLPPAGATGRVFFNDTAGPYRAETLYVAGVLAMAARTPLVAQVVPDRVATYRDAAIRVFAGFEAHDADASFWQPDSHPYDNWTSGAHPWSDEMLVAAANLFELTGEAKYLTWLQAEAPADLAATRLWGWVTEGPWLNAYVSMATMTRAEAATLRDAARAAIVAWADALGNRQDWPAPFGAPLPSFAYDMVGWYFSASQVAFPLMVAYGVSGEAKYRDDLVRTWSYLLGGNPLSRSYVSGLGQPDRRPRWIVHEIWQYQWAEHELGNGGWSEVPPGLYAADLQDGQYDGYLADGGWNSARMYERFPALAEYPALYRYHDSWTVKNEFTINQLARGSASVIPLVVAVAPPVDGGIPDGGVVPDGGAPAPDGAGGADAGDGGVSGGCGCRAAAGPGGGVLTLVLLGLLALRRRR